MHVAIAGIRVGHQGAIYKLLNTSNSIISVGGDAKVIAWAYGSYDAGKVIVQTQHTCYAMAQFYEFLYLGERGGKVFCISLVSKKVLHFTHLHSGDIFAILPKDDQVWVLSADGSFSVWSADLSVLLYHNKISTKSLRNIIYIHEKQCFIISSSDGYIYCIREDNFQIADKFVAHADAVFSLALLPDSTFVSGGKDAQLIRWDVHTLQLLQKIPAHIQTINHIALSPDKTLLATAGRDKCIKIWSVADMQLLKVLDTKYTDAHIHSVNTVLWIDDFYLLSAGDDKRIIEWKIGL